MRQTPDCIRQAWRASNVPGLTRRSVVCCVGARQHGFTKETVRRWSSDHECRCKTYRLRNYASTMLLPARCNSA